MIDRLQRLHGQVALPGSGAVVLHHPGTEGIGDADDAGFGALHRPFAEGARVIGQRTHRIQEYGAAHARPGAWASRASTQSSIGARASFTPAARPRAISAAHSMSLACNAATTSTMPAAASGASRMSCSSRQRTIRAA